MRSRKQNALRLTGMLVACGLFIYLLSQQGWDEIWAAIASISTWRFLLAIALMGASRLAISLRWYALLQSARLKITFPESLRVSLAGLFASNFLPTTIGGDVIRLAGGMQLGLDAAICTASLIADRLVGIVGMAMVLPFSLPGLAAVRDIFLGLSTRQAFLATLPLGKWWQTLQKKTSGVLTRLLQSLKIWLRNPGGLIKPLVYSWIHMLCLFSVLQVLLGGIGETLPFWLTAGLYSLVYFITLLPISINGYGVQEISIMLIFSNLGKASVSSSLTAALLFRTLMMFASLPGAIFLPDIFSFSQRKKIGSNPDRPAP